MLQSLPLTYAASTKVIQKKALNEVINTKDNKTMQTTSAVFFGINKNKFDANQSDDIITIIKSKLSSSQQRSIYIEKSTGKPEDDAGRA